MAQLSFHSPVGDLTLTEEDGAIVALDWGWACENEETPLLDRARGQLLAYFDGDRQAFDLPLAPRGTTFQRRIWDALMAIPHGEVRTYGEIARQSASAPRAVGGACARNPIPIIIPCHRVVGHAGAMGGYSGLDGIDTKRFLLRLEGRDIS